MGRPKMYDEDLRERLIEEAAKLLEDDGYHAVSLRVLTKNAGTSTNAVYTLFGSKEALMGEVIVRDTDRKLQQALEHAPNNDPLTRLIYLTSYFREIANRSPMFFRGFIAAVGDAQQSTVTSRSNVDVLEIGDRVFQPLHEACVELVEENPSVDADPVDVALSFWSTLHGLIDLEIEGLLGRRLENVDDLYLQAIHALYLGWISGKVNDFDPKLVEGFKQAQSQQPEAAEEEEEEEEA